MSMPVDEIEKRLWDILDDTYGGPSLSYVGGAFVIYRWGDAPVSEEILATGYSLEEVLLDWEKKHG